MPDEHPTRHSCELARMTLGALTDQGVPASALLPIRRWLACASMFAWNVKTEPQSRTRAPSEETFAP